MIWYGIILNPKSADRDEFNLYYIVSIRLIYMLVFNGSKYHVKPSNVESRSVRVVKCENDEAKIPGEMSLRLQK